VAYPYGHIHRAPLQRTDSGKPSHIHGGYYTRITPCTVNPALLASRFVWLIQLSLLHISLFKEIINKYFSQGKCEFMKILFVLLGKIKILTL
jgi:hypothetical protein